MDIIIQSFEVFDAQIVSLKNKIFFDHCLPWDSLHCLFIKKKYGDSVLRKIAEPLFQISGSGLFGPGLFCWNITPSCYIGMYGRTNWDNNNIFLKSIHYELQQRLILRKDKIRRDNSY